MSFCLPVLPPSCMALVLLVEKWLLQLQGRSSISARVEESEGETLKRSAFENLLCVCMRVWVTPPSSTAQLLLTPPLASSVGKSLLFPKRRVYAFLLSNLLPFPISPRILPRGLLARGTKEEKNQQRRESHAPQAPF